MDTALGSNTLLRELALEVNWTEILIV